MDVRQLQAGDIAACYGTSRASRLIRWGTRSWIGPRRLRRPPSHVAILCEHRGGVVWAESTTFCRHPCLFQRRRVSGCQAHLPEQRIRDYRGEGGRVDIYRLSPIQSLSLEDSGLLSEIVRRHFIERSVQYDLGGALLSGTRAFKLTPFFPGADLNEVFCSELIAALLQRLGRMNLCNPTRFNPAKLLRELVRQGTYRFAGEASRDEREPGRIATDETIEERRAA